MEMRTCVPVTLAALLIVRSQLDHHAGAYTVLILCYVQHMTCMCTHTVLLRCAVMRHVSLEDQSINVEMRLNVAKVSTARIQI